MKICQICPYDLSMPGGVQTHIVQLSRALRKKGHHVSVVAVSGKRTVDYDFEYKAIGRAKRIPIWGTSIDVTYADKADRKRAQKFFAERKFDVVHFHTLWNPFLPLQMLFLTDAAKVATFHDTPPDSVFGTFLGSSVMPAAAGLLIRFLDAVISVSDSQASYITPLTTKDVHIIPNGIDLELFNGSAKEKMENGSSFTLLFLGRLEPRKGVMDAIRIFEGLKTQYPALRMVVAGEGKQKETAEAYVKKKEIRDIEFLGYVFEEKKLELFRKADLYLSPARYGESFGIVLLEAMASETPVAGYGNEGYLNVVKDYSLENFPPPGEPKKLSRRIEKLINNPALREELKVEGRKIVREYSWETLSDRIIRVYEEACQ